MSAALAPLFWSQFILAAALERVAKRFAMGSGNDPFCYADTHAGPGVNPLPVPVTSLLPQLGSQTYFGLLKQTHTLPGSWVVAERVLGTIFSDADDYEIDINDISPLALEQARTHHHSGRLRLWSHDWYKFLRDRLSMARPPHFVFIDPPADDPRGPEFAINAALLLDTLHCPDLIT